MDADNNPISALIGYLVNHIYVVLVLAGVLWSILGKLRKGGDVLHIFGTDSRTNDNV